LTNGRDEWKTFRLLTVNFHVLAEVALKTFKQLLLQRAGTPNWARPDPADPRGLETKGEGSSLPVPESPLIPGSQSCTLQLR
jgi:hypothetical protein